jgi:hypothetical protein
MELLFSTVTSPPEVAVHRETALHELQTFNKNKPCATVDALLHGITHSERLEEEQAQLPRALVIDNSFY